MNLIGVKLNITELRGNMIAYTVSDGKGHYTLIREVTSNTVKLADPTQGNIEIPLEEFQKIYTCYTLTTTNQTETTENTTETENQTNPENQTETEPHINTEKILSTEEMQNIKGKNWKYRLKKKGKWHGEELTGGRFITGLLLPGQCMGVLGAKRVPFISSLYLIFEPSEGRYYRTHCGWWY